MSELILLGGVTLILDIFSDYFFPSACRVCGMKASSMKAPELCRTCWDSIPFIKAPYCFVCSIPFDPMVTLPERSSYRCGSCQRHQPFFDRAICAGLYETPLAEIVRQFKYDKRSNWSTPLTELLMTRTDDLPGADVVLAVPLHPDRLRQREYNQSLLLAREVSRRCQVSLQLDNLMRVRSTRSQVALSGKARKENVRGAFTIRRSGQLKGKTVWLIDDVVTTGATINECAKTLKMAGVREVFVLALVRMV